MSGNPRSLGGFLARGIWFPIVLSVVSVGFYAWSESLKPPRFCSLATVSDGRPLVDNLPPLPAIADIFASEQMNRRASEHLRSIEPDLKHVDVEVQVWRRTSPAVYELAAFGSDREYTKVFLNTVLDEVMSDCADEREQWRHQGLANLANVQVRVIDRASPAVEEVREWLLAILVKSFKGLVVGSILLLLAGGIWVGAVPKPNNFIGKR